MIKIFLYFYFGLKNIPKYKMTELICATIVIILLLALYWYSTSSEGFEPIYLDEMAMKYSDPMFFKYSSWERDVDGMSPRDYYLENQMNYGNQIAPGYFKGNRLFTDKTDYLNMPPQYRPKRPMQTSGCIKIEKNYLDTMPVSAGSLIIPAERKFSGAMDRDVNMAYTWEKCC